MKIRMHPEPDSIDAAHLDDTIRTAGFARIAERIHQARQQTVNQLIEAKSWDEALKLQGQIQGMDIALSIPGILRKEYSERKKQR